MTTDGYGRELLPRDEWGLGMATLGAIFIWPFLVALIAGSAAHWEIVKTVGLVGVIVCAVLCAVSVFTMSPPNSRPREPQ